jgi:hydroxymethyl cephem carbamoyltransferase
VKILSYNPGHDGAITFLQDARLMMSIEAEKDSNCRYSPVSGPDVFNALGDIDEIPDVMCMGGWWLRDHYEYLHGSDFNAGYRGVSKSDVIVGQRRVLGL